MAEIHINEVFTHLDELKKADSGSMFGMAGKIAEHFSIEYPAAQFVLAKWMHANGYLHK